MKPKTATLVGTTAIAVMAAVAFLWSEQTVSAMSGLDDARPSTPAGTVAPSRTPDSPMNESRASPFGSGPPKIPAPGALARSVPSEALIGIFNSDQSVRDKIAEAKRHVERGGAFYGEALLRQCRTLLGTSSDSDTPLLAGDKSSMQRREAVESLQRRCGDASGSSTQEERDLLEVGRKEGDPLLAAQDALRSAIRTFKEDPASAASRRAAVAIVVSLRDPLLFEAVSDRLLLHVDAATSKKFYWFNGNSYALDSDAEVSAALSLVPCGLGLRCDSTDYWVSMRCLSGEGCDENRFAYLRRLFASRPGVYERVEGLYGEILEAVQTNNVSAFVR